MKQRYEIPNIVDERSVEVYAMGCNKIPGIGDLSYCGPVWSGAQGQSDNNCHMNEDSRSS
jgi:hypothetical protein